MKVLSFGLTGIGLAMFVTGCSPDLAQVKSGPDEKEWQQFVSTDYSGYRPPRTTAPAEIDKYVASQQQPAATAAETPAAAEQPAAENSGDEAVVVEPVTDEAAPAKADAKAAAPAKADAKAAPAKAEAAQEATVYVVKGGDTLSGIAKKFYHDGRRSGLILKANPKIKNPNQIRPGMKLNIAKM